MLKRKKQYYLLRVLNVVKSIIWNFKNKTIFSYWGVKYGVSLNAFGPIYIINLGKITIGENTRLNSGLINVVGHGQKLVLYSGQNGQINIGNNCGISNTVLVSQNRIDIDEFVYIGGGTRVYDNDFHSIDFYTRVNLPTKIPSKPIRIKKGAFIGAHSTILKGVTIGEEAVIAAGSVVTMNVPNKEVWGGVPAKKIKNL